MKYFLATALVILSTSAFASTKTVPVPPKRPPAPVFVTDPNVYGAYVKNGMVYMRAPLGSDTQIDIVDGDVDVSIQRDNWVNKVLPWNWFK